VTPTSSFSRAVKSVRNRILLVFEMQEPINCNRTFN
jgi:hypothetical protein